MDIDAISHDEDARGNLPIPLFGRIQVPPLPQPSTPQIIGRDTAIRRLVEALGDHDVRLVTLTGPGGIGKTRLALAAASQVSDPVAFIDLSMVSDPALLTPTIAQALGLEPVRDTPPELALRHALQDRALILILDNFEQLLAGRSIVSDLLRGASGLRILVTSRTRLSLSGEHVVQVEPLDLPVVGATADLSGVSAVRLFVARAKAVLPSFDLTDHNAGAVVAICRQLDGLPLAIELAAARCQALSPEALAARLQHRLTLLSGGPHDAPPRHQTMQAAIAWSYDLLGESERRVWEHLSVFTGGFTADAAEAVGQGAADPAQEHLTILQSLVDQGLLLASANREGEPRFRMLETTREFALEQLAASGEEERARSDHAAWFHHYANTLEPGLMGPDSDLWFNRTEADIANIRAALGWLRDRGEIEPALQIAGALAWFWTAPNYIAEGRGWYGELLANAGSHVDPAIRAGALQAAGDLAHWHGDSEAAASLLEQAAASWRQAGDDGRIGATLRSLGSVAIDRMDFDEAVRLLEEARALSHDTGHAWDAAGAANLLGVALLELGRPADAAARHEEALAGWQQLGSTDHLTIALTGLGWTHLQTGDFQRALECFDAAVSLVGEEEMTYDTAWSMVGFAAVAMQLRRHAVATQLLAAAASQRLQIALPLRPHIQRRVDQLTDQVRTQAGSAAFALDWKRGQALSNAEALHLARSIQAPAPVSDDGLSPREREVLNLLVEGASDSEIAERLFITRRTASKHVAAILEKLGTSNRTAAATAAHRRGLV